MPQLVAVMPVGPDCREDFVADSLASVLHYVSGARLVVVDDSGTGVGATAAAPFDATVIKSARFSKAGGLYLTLSDGFREALTEPFDVLLKLDTDALVAGSRFLEVTHSAFTERPQLGVLGIHTDAATSSDTSARDSIRRRTSNLRWVIRDPVRTVAARRLMRKARGHGVTIGSYVFGGICVYSRSAIETMESNSLLGRPELARLGLGEDHLFGLILTSLGMELGGIEDVMGAAWTSLPMSPEDLRSEKRELIHSVRKWEAMDEAAIRRQFAAYRDEDS